MDVAGRRGGMRHSTCRACSLFNGHVPSPAIVNGASCHDGCRASATKSGERSPAGILNGTTPHHMVNGYINHRHRGRCSKAAPPRRLRRGGGTICADASAGVRSRDIADGVSDNGAASLDMAASLGNCDQTPPGPSLSIAAAAAVKNRWRRKKSRQQKRDSGVLIVTGVLMLPQKEEDWEDKLQEVTFTGWEKMSFGPSPYGPEDLLHFALRDLRLTQRERVDLLPNCSPAKHHLRPLKISCYHPPPEPGQFADADE